MKQTVNTLNPTPTNLYTANIPVLISFAICPFVQRSAIIMNVKGQDFERINIDLSNKPKWFLELSPTGKVPVLAINSKSESTGDKPNQSVIFESSIINEYLDEQYGERLMPIVALQKARHRSWISFAESLIFLQYRAMLATELDKANERLNELLVELIKLQPDAKGFFDGDRFSLIDAAYAPLFTRLQWAPELVNKLRDYAQDNQQGKNLYAWIENIINMEAVKISVDENFSEQFEAFFQNLDSALINQSNHKQEIAE